MDINPSQSEEKNQLKDIHSPILVWGSGPAGQLGMGPSTIFETPVSNEFFKGMHISNIACGGMHTFISVNGITCKKRKSTEIHFFLGSVTFLNETEVDHLSLPRIRKLIAQAKQNFNFTAVNLEPSYTALEELVASVFSSPASLNASFLMVGKKYFTHGAYHFH
jgi:hypothetical protein